MHIHLMNGKRRLIKSGNSGWFIRTLVWTVVLGGLPGTGWAQDGELRRGGAETLQPREESGDSGEVSEAVFGRIQFEQSGLLHSVDGEILVTAEDGGMLLRSADLRLWMIQPDEIRQQEKLDQPVVPLDAKQLSAALLEELPDGFRIETTRNFIVAYNTDRMFARWVGNLYEKLLRGFLSHWKTKRGYVLQAPQTPLVVIVYGSVQEYNEHVRRELGSEPGSMVAYYYLMSNRVTLYDLTTQFGAAGGRQKSIPEIIASPGAAEMVATIIHEGTHLLMFNSGMQQRFADTPLWVNEGLAMYFETPDPNSPQGFGAIGQPSPMRLNQFLQYARNRTPESLVEMLTDDSVFRDGSQTLNRYAESWTFNYFLLQRHSDQYVAYLKHLAEKPLMRYDAPGQRLAEFRKFFGDDLQKLDAEFMQYVTGKR